MATIPASTLSTSLKRESIEVPPDDKIISFRNSVIDAFGSKLDSVVLTGSYAKGDYTTGSDIDIWMIFSSLNIQDLKQVSVFLKEYSESPEINLQCVSAEELLAKPFKKWFSPVQLYIDGIVIHGMLPQYLPYNSEIRNYAASIAVEVVMSARHYISSGENEESLAEGRLLKWVLKPLSWVLRYNIFMRNSIFPRNFDDLLRLTIDKNELEIIEVYSEILNGSFMGSYKQLNILCHNAALKLSKI